MVLGPCVCSVQWSGGRRAGGESTASRGGGSEGAPQSWGSIAMTAGWGEGRRKRITK